MKVRIEKSLVTTADPDVIWRVAGEYCSISRWHPAFSDCTREMADGAVWRVLTLKKGGGKVRERLTDITDRSYDYTIVEAPLPISNHHGKLSVEAGAKPGESVLRWDISYDIDDAARADEASNALDGILTDGLANIARIAGESTCW
ncbi:SRPBCC family protein [Bradyrhizobium tropiciagri]|uniref:SRPBCC family protein n=1 Tax=Bradyrhizobium tropiciagri TaxID=312253 RepID=UPI001BACA41B|nr:SRPBCC family protein [Bradyrhizobium tropiciagri]MBR0898878.1 SRPBCC family protein [Bradyrhizobium tropiciagri]